MITSKFQTPLPHKKNLKTHSHREKITKWNPKTLQHTHTHTHRKNISNVKDQW